MAFPSLVFVTGLHRSGTSPLHRCLRHHPQISGFENTGVPEDEGQHLQTVLPRGGAYGGPGRFGRHPEAHMTETHPQANAATADQLFAQWRSHWDLSKPWLVEKTPINLTRTRFFQALFPSAAFVVIVRHPAPVALATYNALASNGAAQDLTITALVEHWLLCHELFREDSHFLKRLHVLNYEHFIAQPQATLDSVFAFLGLPSYQLTEPVEPTSNDRYQAQWNAMREDPAFHRDREQALAYEEQVETFGYSLRDWNICSPF